MKNRVLLLALFLLVGFVYGQDSNQVRKYICDLTSPAFHGRGYAYNGDSIAAEYLRAQLRDIGVEPFAKDYFHHYGFNVYAMEGPVKASLDGKMLQPWADFALLPSPIRQMRRFSCCPSSLPTSSIPTSCWLFASVTASCFPEVWFLWI